MEKGKFKDIILSIDEENNRCIDCKKENPTKVSVNNGIIICEECAVEHAKLGTSISYVRDLLDDFDEYLLNYFTLGGNSKFNKFLKEENVDTSLPINQKYLTKACFLYRMNLKRKIQGKNPKEKNYENPNEIEENPENNFPEFENYEIKNEVKGNKTKVDQAKKVLGNIGSGLFGFGKKMYSGVKQGANFVAVKAKPATNKIKKGAEFMGHQVGGAYNNLKNKIVNLNKGKNKNVNQEGEEKNENNKEENNEIGNNLELDQKEKKEDEGPGQLINQPSINFPVQEEKAEP